MSSNIDDAVAGPSIVNDLEATEPEPQKKVQFDNEDESSSDTRNDSQVSYRRQSLMGESGFVTQLLEQELDNDSDRSDEEFESNPIRKQTLSERRDSVKAVDTDLSNYMKLATRKSKGSISFKNGSSQTKLPTLSSTDETLPNSEWKPTEFLEYEQTGTKQAISWVGSYILGKDYWDPKQQEDEKVEEDKSKEVDFSLDEKPKSWYEMPVTMLSNKESTFSITKLRAENKIKALREKMDKEYEQKRKQRTLAAAHARQETKETDEWPDEFKEYFEEMSRASEFSHGGTHLLLVEADKWLEKAEVLDHNQLTLVHTGFCFLACGGSRYRGLSFNEFTQFLRMISFTAGLPLRDLIGRMIACLRKPGHG